MINSEPSSPEDSRHPHMNGGNETPIDKHRQAMDRDTVNNGMRRGGMHKMDESMTKMQDGKPMMKQGVRSIAVAFYWMTLAVLFSGVLVSASIIYSFNKYSSSPGSQARPTSGATDSLEAVDGTGQDQAENIKPVTADEHILGDPDAPIKIVEFSDTECPFCKRFHSTMQQVADEYGESGQVAWVYRHFPLDAIHSKTRKEAEATECANELGGNQAFWSYLDKIFEITPSNNGLDPAELPNIAEQIGLDRGEFGQCLDSGKYAQHIEDDLTDAQNAGGTGTPYSVVIAPNDQTYIINGAQPFSAVKSIIDIALEQ